MALPTVEDGSGSWAWKDAATTSVGNAGEQTFKAVFTPANTNYTPVEQEVTINVAKADPTPASFDALTATYGSTLADITLPKGWAWKDDTLSVGDLGIKRFVATYTPADTNNYNVIEGGVQINVVAVDKTSLNDAITAANTYLAKIQTTVYADPALALISAINDAKSVAENDKVTEEQVAQAIKAVNKAVTTAQDAVKDIDDAAEKVAAAEAAQKAAEKSAQEAADKAAAAETAKKAAEDALAKGEADAAEKVAAAEAAQKAAEEAQAKADADKAIADQAAQDAAEAQEEAEAAADQAAADKVIKKIDAIGEVKNNISCENDILSARSAYDTLTDAQQALVTNYNVLTAAESEYETISKYYAPVERLCEMAIKDYEVQNGTTPANAEAEKNADGTLSIQLTDENGKVLDTYTIDPVTATGIDTDKTNVNLPQTGVTSKSTAAAVGGALAMIAAGFWMTIRSFRRKKDEE